MNGEFLAPAFGLVTLVFPLIGFFILYWVIRLAVRHGMQDVERDRQIHG